MASVSFFPRILRFYALLRVSFSPSDFGQFYAYLLILEGFIVFYLFFEISEFLIAFKKFRDPQLILSTVLILENSIFPY